MGTPSKTKQRQSLRALIDEWKAKHGEPNTQEVAWAKRALAQKRGK